MGTSARVQVTLEIDAGSSWGDDCQLSQVYTQAEREVLNRLNRLLQEEKVGVRLIGKPVVTAVTTRQGER